MTSPPYIVQLVQMSPESFPPSLAPFFLRVRAGASPIALLSRHALSLTDTSRSRQWHIRLSEPSH